MKSRKVHLIRSETWLTDDFEAIAEILQGAIKDFVKEERIINIQVVKQNNGLSRFWIYIED